jgi:hypothetical protein
MRKHLVPLLLALALLFTGCGQTAEVPAAADDGNQPATEVNNPANPGASEQAATAPPSASDSRLYTMEKYAKIQPGQTYEEVQSILGDPGENMVDNERLKQFQWTNEDDSMISVTFYDNEMIGKAQAHLGPLLEGGQAVTKNMFEQLEEGMTLEEVTSILGSGNERVLNIFDGEVEQIIGWENSDGSEISITLFNGSVTGLSDFMLK